MVDGGWSMVDGRGLVSGADRRMDRPSPSWTLDQVVGDGAFGGWTPL